MASFSGPKLSNRIADDVPDIQAVLSSLAKLTPDSGNTDYPIGTKRVAETTNGYEFQQYNGTGWVTLEKWNLDAQKVDGYSASTGTTANTIPVRNANGKLPGDILGNAATATKANALSETNPIPMGGTGATTAEQARANLGTPPKTHASTSTEYGTGTSTQYGHLKSHDAPDSTLTAASGHAFSPAGAFALQDYFASLVGGVEGDLSSLDSTLRALIAEEVAKCLKTSGGTMEGSLHFGGVGDIRYSDNSDYRTLWINRNEGSAIGVFSTDSPSNPGALLLRASDGGRSTDLWLHPEGSSELDGYDILTAKGGTLTGVLYKERGDLFVGLRDDAYYGIYGCTNYGKGARIILSGKDCEGWNGEIQLQACDGVNFSNLRIIPDGGLLINGQAIESVEAKGSRYIRFESGLQLCYATALPCGTWTFPAAFASPPAVTITPNGSNNSATIKTNVPTTTKVDGVYNSLTWNMTAIAVGWWK